MSNLEKRTRLYMRTYLLPITSVLAINTNRLKDKRFISVESVAFVKRFCDIMKVKLIGNASGGSCLLLPVSRARQGTPMESASTSVNTWSSTRPA